MPNSIDEERILVGAVGRAPVFDDPEPPGRELVGDPVIQQDHAIRDVLLQALPSQRLLSPLPGDDGGDAALLEPAKQPAQLGAEDGVVREAG